MFLYKFNDIYSTFSVKMADCKNMHGKTLGKFPFSTCIHQIKSKIKCKPIHLSLLKALPGLNDSHYTAYHKQTALLNRYKYTTTVQKSLCQASTCYSTPGFSTKSSFSTSHIQVSNDLTTEGTTVYIHSDMESRCLLESLDFSSLRRQLELVGNDFVLTIDLNGHTLCLSGNLTSPLLEGHNKISLDHDSEDRFSSLFPPSFLNALATPLFNGHQEGVEEAQCLSAKANVRATRSPLTMRIRNGSLRIKPTSAGSSALVIPQDFHFALTHVSVSIETPAKSSIGNGNGGGGGGGGGSRRLDPIPCPAVAVHGQLSIESCTVEAVPSSGSSKGIAEFNSRALLEVQPNGWLFVNRSRISSRNRPALTAAGTHAKLTVQLSNISAQYDSAVQDAAGFFMRVQRRRGLYDGAAAASVVHNTYGSRLSMTGCRISVTSPRYMNALTCVLPYFEEEEENNIPKATVRQTEAQKATIDPVLKVEGCVLEYLHPDLETRRRGRAAGGVRGSSGSPLAPSSSSSFSSSSPTASQGPLPMPPGATGPLPSLSGDLDVGSYKELATRMYSATANGLVFLYDSPLTGCFSPGSDSNSDPGSDSGSDSGSTASHPSPSPSPASCPSSPFPTPPPPPLPPNHLASDKADDSNLRIHPLDPSNDGWPPYVISFRGCLFLGNGLPHAVEQFSGFGSTFDECEFWDCSIADLHFDSGSKSDMHRCVFAKQGLKRQEGWDVQVDTPRYSVYSTTLLKYNVMGGGKIRIHSCDVDHPMAAEAGAGIVRTPEEVTVRITGTSPDFRHVVQPRVY